MERKEEVRKEKEKEKEEEELVDSIRWINQTVR